MARRQLGIDVLTAARERIAWALEQCPRAYVSFSGGKDSTVMAHLVAEEARRQGRRIGLLFIDLEAQYALTIEHVHEVFRALGDIADPYWVALPLALRNAVSQYQPKWQCWDPDCPDDWVRRPPAGAIIDPGALPFFRRGMEFEEFIIDFGEWYSQGLATACFVGIRTQESLNRWRTIAGHKRCLLGRQFTTRVAPGVYNIYPIYDWKTEDIWTYHGKSGVPCNRLYDRMHQAGLTIHQQRICQPYGDDQRKGLWLYHLIEPETWGRVVVRVNGANSGALYSQESGNIQGRTKVTLPPGHTWQSFAMLILETLPPKTRDHYQDKIAVFLKWWQDRGYPAGIPDVATTKEEAGREKPSWRRICKALLRNDWWCKGLSFSQPASGTDAYRRYKAMMRRRRARWGIFSPDQTT